MQYPPLALMNNGCNPTGDVSTYMSLKGTGFSSTVALLFTSMGPAQENLCCILLECWIWEILSHSAVFHDIPGFAEGYLWPEECRGRLIETWNDLPSVLSYSPPPLFFFLLWGETGEICGFRIHGAGVPFEAVILDKATGEGLIRAKEPVDCEAHKEHTFTIQAYDCGEGPDGANTKKSHK